MTLTNPKPLGWAFGELLTSAQMNSVATQLPYAIDGNAGGTYANTNPIVLTGDFSARDIGGRNLTTTGNSALGNSSGDVATAQQLSVVHDATVAGTTDVQGLLVHDQAFLDLDLDVTGQVACSSLEVVGPGNVLGQLQFLFKCTAGVLADHAYTTLDAGQIIFVETLPADRTYTFAGSFDAGAWFLFKNRSGTGATLHVNGVDLAGTGQGVLWFYNGANWRFFKLDEIFA